VTISLTTHLTFQDTSRLPFCYLCGQSFGSSDDTNRDHVPPSGLFARADRAIPLVHRTHRRCNELRSPEDQAIGQLVGVLHGRRVNRAHDKLRIRVGRFPDGHRVAAVTGLDIREAIRRWVRGFHAALYREYLSLDAVFATYPPLPEGRPAGDHVEYGRIPDVLPKLVEELKRNRAVENLDRVVCRNGKCRYECVWSQADDGRWMCIYGLDLYNWKKLGDGSQPARGCVGCYLRPAGGIPPNASVATRLVFDMGRTSSFDPFDA
jgi:hypothetical protein